MHMTVSAYRPTEQHMSPPVFANHQSFCARLPTMTVTVLLSILTLDV